MYKMQKIGPAATVFEVDFGKLCGNTEYFNEVMKIRIALECSVANTGWEYHGMLVWKEYGFGD